jgi:Peptidase family M48
MRRCAFLTALSVVVIVSVRGQLESRAQAQVGNASRTMEGTTAGGWAAPCDRWWDTSSFRLNAARVCRVTTHLITAIERTTTATQPRAISDQLFRICWGNFPRSGRSGGACAASNAWARSRGWIAAAGPKPPVVITLKATEDLQSDDEVAFVLGHEMGHALDREQSVDKNTHQNEERADVAGIGFVMRAGYDARSAGRGLQMILGERGQGLLGNLKGMLDHAGDGADVHGLTRNRIAVMKQIFARGCAVLNNQAIGCKEGWK